MDFFSDFPPRTLAALSLVSHSDGVVKRLSGFRKDRHKVPDAVNPATQAFFARLCAEEIAEEAESWFQRARTSLAYKRRDLTLSVGPASAVLTARDFNLHLDWTLRDDDPTTYTMTRTLRDMRAAEFPMSSACDVMFADAFSDIVFTLTRGVAVEAVIDAVEALPEPASMVVHYPADCSECTMRVSDVDAEVRCTGATLELVFSRTGSPRELIEAFGEVRAAFRFTKNESLAGLL